MSKFKKLKSAALNNMNIFYENEAGIVFKDEDITFTVIENFDGGYWDIQFRYDNPVFYWPVFHNPEHYGSLNKVFTWTNVHMKVAVAIILEYLAWRNSQDDFEEE